VTGTPTRTVRHLGVEIMNTTPQLPARVAELQAAASAALSNNSDALAFLATARSLRAEIARMDPTGDALGILFRV
jgi:hypothetical protein